MSNERLICPHCRYSPELGDDDDQCPLDGRHLVALSEYQKAPRDPFLGTVLGGKYPILSVLGAGGMGTVYGSIQPLVEREVAIKVILPTPVASEEDGEAAKDAQRRFLREAKALAALSHPGLVTLHDFGTEEDGTLFMVMERIDGWTLGQMVRDQRLDQRQAVDLVALALDGLAAAHASGLIHRDLKPENIMVLRPDGSSGPAQRVKLLDFGLVFTSGARESRITKSGLVFGTPAYMCPEQARGGVEMDERSDIYSMSVVLYEAVAGRLPFDCDQPHQFMFKHVSDPPDPLPEFVPAQLRDIIERGLQKDPTLRFQDAASMSQSLRAVDWSGVQDGLGDLGPSAPSRDTTSTLQSAAAEVSPSSTPVAIPRRRIAVAAAFVGLLLAGVVLSRLSDAPPAPQPAARQPLAASEETPPPRAALPSTQLDLVSVPPGAKILDAEGKRVGTTPAAFFLDAPLGEVVHYRLEAPGYESESVKITMDGSTHKHRINLARSSAKPHRTAVKKRRARRKTAAPKAKPATRGSQPHGTPGRSRPKPLELPKVLD